MTNPEISAEDLSGYAADAEEAGVLTEDTLKQLQIFSDNAVRTQGEIATLEAQLAQKNATLSQLLERDIPSLMDSVGMSEIKLTTGVKVAVTEKVRASIPKPRHDEGIQWLDEHGEGGMVKRKIVILFNKDEEGWANKFMADCRKRKQQLRMDVERTVHPQTLLAWVNDKLKSGGEIDEGLFGVFRQRIAKIALPKGEG